MYGRSCIPSAFGRIDERELIEQNKQSNENIIYFCLKSSFSISASCIRHYCAIAIVAIKNMNISIPFISICSAMDILWGSRPTLFLHHFPPQNISPLGAFSLSPHNIFSPVVGTDLPRHRLENLQSKNCLNNKSKQQNRK